jgi:hypothetical protein
MSSIGTGEYCMRAGVDWRIARRIEEDTASHRWAENMSGTGAGEYCMGAGVARRIARRLDEDTVSPQVGRKHVRYRDQGELHAGLSSPEDCQEAGGRYRLPTGGQKHVRYRDRGVLHAGRSSSEDC